VLSVGPVLALCNQIEEDDLALQELWMLQSGAPPADGSFCCCCGGLANWVYKRWLCLWSSPAAAYAARKAASDKRRKLLSAKEGEPLKPTGNAIVVFNYESHTMNMRQDHQRVASGGIFSKLIRNAFPPTVVRRFHFLTGLLLAPRGAFGCSMHTRLGCIDQAREVFILAQQCSCACAAGGSFSRAPRMPVEINRVEAERYVLVQRAPEPSAFSLPVPFLLRR
jgi:hypothetical protein